jgi:adenosylcobinamide kinase/adenosylcobinamide-phosphate guanylyltransferase
VLLLGGARSGKSAEAELRLAAEPEVTYVATGPGPGTDRDWAARVAAHRSRRPHWWRTAETLDLAGQLRVASGALLVDGIGTWLAGKMGECGIWAALEAGQEGAASECLAGCIADLLDAWRHTRAYVVAVSDEAGSGVVPATASGRRFRDELGHLNQLLAAESDETALVVAGRVLPLPV